MNKDSSLKHLSSTNIKRYSFIERLNEVPSILISSQDTINLIPFGIKIEPKKIRFLLNYYTLSYAQNGSIQKVFPFTHSHLMQNSSSVSLTSFKYFKRFHWFYYSQHDGEVFLLLRKKKNFYLHIKGHLEDLEPAILFSVGRKLMKLSYGLLIKQNLNLFAENSTNSQNLRDILQLCKPQVLTPHLCQSKVFQKFIEDTFIDMKQYQDETDAAYFFIEVPYINLEKFNSFCRDIKLNLELAYVSQKDIELRRSNLIHSDLQSLFMSKSLNEYIKINIEQGLAPPITGRYAILSIVTTPTNYRTLGLLGSYFKKHGEEWKNYRYPIEEPIEEEICQFDGIFIPGASVCATDKSLPWRDKLLRIIRLASEPTFKCKILGTCFGIQIISEAFQGKCEKMKEMITGTSKLSINPSFWDLPYVQELNIPPRDSLLIPKSHCDAVTEAPRIATVLASSETCPVEIMAIGEKCLAFQGHPEINEAWTACLLYQATKEKLCFKLYYEEIKKKFFNEKLEHEMWLQILYNFLKKK